MTDARRSAPLDLQGGALRFNGATGTWVRLDQAPSLAYSDGDEVEQRLLDIVTRADDISSASLELRDRVTDWPSLYHLSPLRANLLRPLANLLGGEVLEVGAGCGGLTRFLGEHATRVVAVEGSERRAAIAAARCRDLDSVAVVAAPFHECRPEARFDVVTLIGVLEYARRFFPGEGGDPVDALLAFSRRFLNPGGVLILAIENQLGLKYFAGALEDHLGVPMIGIEDRYPADHVVTFGRDELRRRVASAGLPITQWLFPFPDYKLPVVLLTESAVAVPPDIDLSPLVTGSMLQDPHLPNPCAFTLERAWIPVVRNKLFLDLANSFLVLARERADEGPPSPIIAHHFAVNRRKPFCKKVAFILEDDDVVVHASRVYEDVAEPGVPFKMHLEAGSFLRGKHWHTELVRIVSTDGWQVSDVTAWAQVWLAALPIAATRVMSTNVPGRWFDAIPQNMVQLHDGSVQFFDLEWIPDGDIPIGHVVLRGLLYSLLSLTGVARPVGGTPVAIGELLDLLISDLKLTFEEGERNAYIAREATFQNAVAAITVPLSEPLNSGTLHVRESLVMLAARVSRAESAASGAIEASAALEREIAALRDGVSAREAQVVVKDREIADRDVQLADRDRRIADYWQQISGLNQQLQARAAQVTDIFQSTSWRVTKPLRWTRRQLDRALRPKAGKR